MSHLYCMRSSYERLKATFIRNGEGSTYDSPTRAEIVRRFEAVDAGMNITSSSTDGLFLAEALLSLECPGHAVECGCYTGGSTSKLSIVSKVVGRELVVFDSFEGLPEVDDYNLNDHHARRNSSETHAWTAGRYAAKLDLVKANVERFGELGVCTFVKGWFADTLTGPNVPQSIALAFTDVDIASSARDCLLGLWPSLAAGGAFFTHDVAYIKVMQELTNPVVWDEEFHEPVPILFGAGYGLCDSSPHLGFMIKGAQSADYIKGLLLEK